ncbi:MAG: hypothetical protein R3E39_27095 [Anaerolineae bacterium]
MLKTLSGYALVLVGTWLLFAIAAMRFGQMYTLPDDSRVTELAWCDDQPCILGVSPGKTMWRDAQTQLASYSDSEIQDKSIIVQLQPDAEAAMYRSINGAAVGPVYMMFEQPMSLGWILELFGKPCGISFYTRAEMATLRYPFMLANLQLAPDQQHISIDLPVRTLHFRDVSYQSEVQPDLCYDNITDGARNLQWSGFAPLWHYVSPMMR